MVPIMVEEVDNFGPPQIDPTPPNHTLNVYSLNWLFYIHLDHFGLFRTFPAEILSGRDGFNGGQPVLIILNFCPRPQYSDFRFSCAPNAPNIFKKWGHAPDFDFLNTSPRDSNCLPLSRTGRIYNFENEIFYESERQTDRERNTIRSGTIFEKIYSLCRPFME